MYLAPLSLIASTYEKPNTGKNVDNTNPTICMLTAEEFNEFINYEEVNFKLLKF